MREPELTPASTLVHHLHLDAQRERRADGVRPQALTNTEWTTRHVRQGLRSMGAMVSPMDPMDPRATTHTVVTAPQAAPTVVA